MISSLHSGLLSSSVAAYQAYIPAHNSMQREKSTQIDRCQPYCGALVPGAFSQEPVS